MASVSRTECSAASPEAEDVAQEAVLRYARTEEAIDEPNAWITTAATRLSIDVLRTARVRRVSYVGPWLPNR